MAPEKILVIDAVASATPSTTPIVTMLAPSVETMKIGNRLWTSSDEASMKSEPRPSTQTPVGNAPSRFEVGRGRLMTSARLDARC